MSISRFGFGPVRTLCTGVFVCGLFLSSSVALAQTNSEDSQQAPVADSQGLPGNFFQRLGEFYGHDWKGPPPSGPAPRRRALDAPLDSPPFPSSDWGYGGSSPIGVPDGNVYPLMNALNRPESRTKIYGWVAVSGNYSTSDKNNFPLSYDIFPTEVVMNQFVVYAERLPDTVQHDHFDWGFHLTSFYGTDYRF